MIELKDVSSVYWRTYDARQLPAVLEADEATGDGAALAAADAVESALSSWLEVTEALVVNRPSAMASNGSKPYQAELFALRGSTFRPP